MLSTSAGHVGAAALSPARCTEMLVQATLWELLTAAFVSLTCCLKLTDWNEWRSVVL
jgi:hypothetical protein